MVKGITISIFPIQIVFLPWFTWLHVIDHTCIWKPQQQYRWKLKMNEWLEIIAMSTYMFNTTKGVWTIIWLAKNWMTSFYAHFWVVWIQRHHIPPSPSPPQLVPNVPNHIHSLRRFIKFLFPMVFRILFIMQV